jgi:hypothetical protein
MKAGKSKAYEYNNNSMALVCEIIIPTDLSPLVGEVSANFF